jgi:hypothetical protein
MKAAFNASNHVPANIPAVQLKPFGKLGLRPAARPPQSLDLRADMVGGEFCSPWVVAGHSFKLRPKKRSFQITFTAKKGNQVVPKYNFVDYESLIHCFNLMGKSAFFPA